MHVPEKSKLNSHSE